MSHFYTRTTKLKYRPCDSFRYPETLSSKVYDAFKSGDYSTATKLLSPYTTPYNSKPENTDNLPKCPREHALLARAICYHQQREHSRVLVDTSEVIKSYISKKSVAATTMNILVACQDNQASDLLFCYILALWLRSLAYESCEEWQKAKEDLDALKVEILKHINIDFLPDGVLLLLLPNMSPLIASTNHHGITINLQCVTERLRRISNLVIRDLSCRSNPAQAFRLIDTDTRNYHDLAQRFHYRLILRKPINSNVHLNMWYTMDLMLVSEMGLFKHEDMSGVEGFTLECKVLEIGSTVHDEKQFGVHVRAMSVESCEWSGVVATDWPGVQSGGKGGLEFKIERKVSNKKVEDSKPNVPNKKKAKLCSNYYLQVFPVMEMVRSSIGGNEASNVIRPTHIVPLVIGPINIITCKSQPNTCGYHHKPGESACDLAKFSQTCISSMPDWSSGEKKTTWNEEDCLVHNFRAFEFPDGRRTLLIKELWDYGIPGKVWDSAFIIARYFKDRIIQDPLTLYGKKVLDLSTGNGFVGLYLAGLVASLSSPPANEITSTGQKTHFILTDLEEALRLVRTNLSLNRYLFEADDKMSIDIAQLRWGDKVKAKKFDKIDIIVASDVVYEISLFEPLIQTLVALCTPQHTKIYLGYKRRGLTSNDEAAFFNKLNSRFKTRVVEGIDQTENISKVKIYELWR